MLFNLEVEICDNSDIFDIENVYKYAVKEMRKHIVNSGIPIVDEQVYLCKHIMFYRTE